MVGNALVSAVRETLPKLASKSFFGLIKNELELVEAEFARQIDSNFQVIKYLGDYLRSSGGKRVRPSLLILSNYASGGRGSAENVIRLAVVMEMLHTATLVHDDIIDNADVRRSQPSINARFGNQTAVLMGDWLYMSAFETSLGERSLEILDVLTRLTRQMTEGELLQLTTLGRTDISEQVYFDILRRKTAYLFSACCEVGAIMSGTNDETCRALSSYGLELGVSFQIMDDLLDFTSMPEEMGKPAGVDLIEGKLTLPLILLRDSKPAIAEQLREVMLTGNYKAVSRELLLEMLHDSGSIEASRERARYHARNAIKNLEVLPETEYCVALGELAAFVIERSS